MANEQSNVQEGDFQVIAYESLTDKEGYLVKLVDDSNVLEAALPDDPADICPFVVIEGAAAGSYVTLRPLYGNQQVRIRLNGTASPGDLVYPLADGTNDGKCAAVGSTPDEICVHGIALEVGVDEQLLLVTPLVIPRYQIGRFLGSLTDTEEAALSPAEGDYWYNSTDHAMKFYNGSDTVIIQGVVE